MPTYSYGEESPIKLELGDKVAHRYNEAVEQFLKAQRRFNQKIRVVDWNPTTDPVEVRWSSKQRKAWADVNRILDRVIKEEGPFHENDYMDDFLVKNTAGAVAVGVASFGWGLSFAVACGVLYGLLNRR